MLLELVLNEKVDCELPQKQNIDFGAYTAEFTINDDSIERKFINNGLPRKRKFRNRFRDNMVVKPRKSAPIDNSETDLCVSLWRSVIVQALYDISGKNGTHERRVMRAEALAWFAAIGDKNEDSDFEYICHLADLSPSKIRQTVKEVRAEGEEIIDGFNFRTVRRDASWRPGRKTHKE